MESRLGNLEVSRAAVFAALNEMASHDTTRKSISDQVTLMRGVVAYCREKGFLDTQARIPVLIGPFKNLAFHSSDSMEATSIAANKKVNFGDSENPLACWVTVAKNRITICHYKHQE